MRKQLSLALLCIGLMASAVDAQSATFSGFLNNPGNSALVGSDLGSPLFGNDFEVANNVALHVISLSGPGTISFRSRGFTAGGVDPFFTLFRGTGNSATFVGSNYDMAFSTGGDFSLSFALSPGLYTIALGAFANMSFPENLGTGTLGDGFIALGQPDDLGTYYYELEVGGLQPPAAIPALADWGIVMLTVFLGLGAWVSLRGRRQV